jgi:sec-independent protein translocase protein TatA
MFRNLFDNPLMLVVIVVLIVLLFGAKRLPDAARSLGRSMRIFKSEVKEMKKDDAASASSTDGRTSSPTSPEALEGRVIHEDHAPRTTTGDTAADAARREV